MVTPDGSRVFLAQSSDRRTEIFRIMGQFDLIADGVTALKANYKRDDPFPASIHLDTLRYLIEGLKSRGSGQVVMAERGGMGRTSDVLANRGVVDLSRSLGFDLVVLDDINPDGWKDIQAQGLHWEHGFRIARIFNEAQKVVETCCLKTHRLGGHFTMSLKNSVGAVAASPKGSSYNYMRELHSSPFQRLMIAEINAFYRTDLGSDGFGQGLCYRRPWGRRCS